MGPQGKEIRVMLVDRHHIVLWGLQQLIDAKKPSMEVVGTAVDCASAIALAEKTLPDVVVVDAELLRGEGVADIPTLINGHSARVLLFSGVDDNLLHETAILRGACGIVRKEETPDVLLKAIADDAVLVQGRVDQRPAAPRHEDPDEIVDCPSTIELNSVPMMSDDTIGSSV